MAEFRSSRNSTYFGGISAKTVEIFGVEILLSGFVHFWANFGQNDRNEITVSYFCVTKFNFYEFLRVLPCSGLFRCQVQLNLTETTHLENC
jgi:ATP/ADP translocase